MNMPMTLDVIRDTFARTTMKGWGSVTALQFRSLDKAGVHPIGDRLEDIIELMPKGWTWTREWRGSKSHPKLMWLASRSVSHSWSMSFYIDDTGDEIRDRGLLALLAQQAEDKRKETRP
jgi:hypothetical protein